MPKLGDFKVLTFDCYGTLIDWGKGILKALSPLVEKSGRALSREEILAAFAREESEEEALNPRLIYREILARVYEALARAWGVEGEEREALAFALSIAEWPPFPDTVAALRYLKGFYKLAILSNVDRSSFAKSREKLGIVFDHVFTAEEIGSYKPDLRNFRFMIEALQKEGFAKSDLLHIAQSLFHDHAPANLCALASVWIDRRAGRKGSGATPPPPPGVRFDFRFQSLSGLVAAHRRERGLARKGTARTAGA